MRRARTCVDYLLLGVLLALGMVSKFNFAVLVLAMGLASLAVPAYRAALLDARLGLTVLVAAGLVAPVLHAQWGLLAAQAAATTAKFALAPAWSLPVALKGAGTAVVALLSWLSPLLVFVLVAAPHVFKAVPAGKPVLTPDGGDAREDERWLRMLGLALLLAVMALVVGSRAAEARTHYYQVAVPLVLWLALRADLQRVDRRRWQAVSALCALLAVVAPALLALEISGAVKVTGKSRLAVPYAGLADALRASGFRQGMVVSQDWPHALSGNLRPYLEGSSFFSLAHSDYLPPLPAGDAQCLVVWQTGEAPAAVKTAPQAVQPLLARETTGLRYGQLVLRTRGPAGVKVGIGWALWPALAPCTTLVEAVRQQ